MAVGISPYTANSILNGMLRNTPFVVPVVCSSLHSGDPGTDASANLITTAEARAQITAAAAVAGVGASTGDPATWNVEEATTLTHLGLHDAFSSGNWLGNLLIDQPVQVVDGDVVTLSAFTATIPGLA